MNKKKEIYLFIFLIFLLILINYSFIDKKLQEFFVEGKIGIVERVIDGDTIVVNGTSIRLLGINSPEKNEFLYEDSKEFLKEMVFNKTVRIKGETKDKYRRTLSYIFLDGKNINLEMVRNGFANFYFPSGRDLYYFKFEKFWKECFGNLNIFDLTN